MHLLIPHLLHLKLHRLRVTNGLRIPPSDPNVRVLPSSKKLTMKTPLSCQWAPNRSVTPRSNMSMTRIVLKNPSPPVDPVHVPRATTLQTFSPPIPMMILYPPWVTLNMSSLEKQHRPLSV